MGFASFEVEANGMIAMDDKGFKDSSSDEFSSVSSMDSGEEEVDSSLSYSPTSPLSHSKSPPSSDDALNDMSSLLQQLPSKRGLSKYYEGKSKSFTCLSNAKSLEDLAKPENPSNKKLKSCKSYVGLYGQTQTIHKTASSKLISKKASRNNNMMNNRPPTHPPPRSNSSTHFSTQVPTRTRTRTPLFV